MTDTLTNPDVLPDQDITTCDVAVDEHEQPIPFDAVPATDEPAGMQARAGGVATLAKAAQTLRAQINRRFPKRDKTSDGWIGDTAHAKRKSDHNPDSRGWVYAIDIDEDFGAPGDAMLFANQLCALARDGKDGGRIKYVIYEDKIASGTANNWHWRGSGYGHRHHIHVSFTAKSEQDGRDFALAILRRPDAKPSARWDGETPDLARLVAASVSNTIRTDDTWRLACRLADLGCYDGIPVRGKQGYPRAAVAAWQARCGFKETGRYGPVAHRLIFGGK